MKKSAFCVMMCLVVCLLLTSGKRDVITIFMIGDSTMANKPTTGKHADNQERGWGQMLQQYFDSTKVVVDNHALNGRSSKSFINEGHWATVLQRIKPGDYVIIQFGHNDEKPKEDRHTDPGTTFDDNLRRFITETREKGGVPVLMNSIIRRKFEVDPNAVVADDMLLNADGSEMAKKQHCCQTDTLVDTHGLYVVTPRYVASEMECLFVDATVITHDYIQPLGPEKSKELFCWLPAGKYQTAPNGRKDDTHLNIYGGSIIAGLLSKELVKQDKTLRKAYLKNVLKDYGLEY